MRNTLLSILLVLSIVSCSSNNEEIEPNEPEVTSQAGEKAVVLRVTVSGDENNYTFNVTLQSPDTGCDQYADWWEIFDEEEELQYRRILAHSHVNEQPFTRSGGPVRIAKDRKVYIRGHMNNLGYGSQVFAGTVADGFQESEKTVSIPLEKTDPKPEGCDF